MIFSVSGSRRSPKDSGHAPRYDPREPGRIPPLGLAASRLAVKIRHPGETIKLRADLISGAFSRTEPPEPSS
jgi:hypothetical protein